MKKTICMALVCAALLGLSACAQEETAATPDVTEATAATEAPTESEAPAAGPEDSTGGTLILYFSCTGNTRAAAEEIQRLTGADIVEIIPETPYTEDDLNYNDSSCRANQEMDDESARPAISGELEGVEAYDTVFLGYPIWWGTAPRIINTLLDACDFSGKTVIPFCTSGSSGIAASVAVIREAEPEAEVMDGLRVGDVSEIEAWLKEIDII